MTRLGSGMGIKDSIKTREYNQRYYLKNRDRELARNREYVSKHRDRILENKKLNHRKNKDKERNQKKIWYENRRHEEIARIRLWQKANPDRIKRTKEQVAEQHHRRRTLKLKADGWHCKCDIKFLYQRQYGLCAYCGRALEQKYHVDHIIALSRGGSNWRRNLALACPSCNLRKHTRRWEQISFTQA